jgi:O-antigen/teichoic acid export membrane protein
VSRRFSIGSVVRGGFWLYLSSVIDNLAGFLYWMIVSAIVGPTVIGIASAISGLAALFLSILNLGVGTGATRFFGVYLGSDDEVRLYEYFWTSFIFNSVVHVVAGIVITLLGIAGYSVSSISGLMLVFASLIIVGGIGAVPSSLITSMMKTEVIFTATTISILFRFVIGITLITIYNLGWVGVVIGNVVQLYTRLTIITTYSIIRTRKMIYFSYRALKDVLIAGSPSWLPGLIASIGSWIGLLSVYVISGALETGYYYVSSAISNVILMISSSILALSFPVLSGMRDGRKRVLSQIMKICLALTLPISTYVMFYPWVPLSLIGSEYVSSSTILTVLLISTVPAIITSSIINLVYAYGRYLLVLIFNLVVSISRLVLYYYLVPNYGGLGSAIAFTVGNYVGLLTTLYIIKSINFVVDWHLIIKVILIPTLLGIPCFILNINWFIALILITSSYIIYLKTKIISKNELKEIIKALHLEFLVSKIYSRYGDVINKILGY